MKRIRAIEGGLGQHENPVWAPLEEVVAKYVTGPFMWMNEVVLDDDRTLQAYKHRLTRQYVHLDDHGEAYIYTDRGYLMADVAEELAICLLMNRQVLLGGDGGISCPRASLRLPSADSVIKLPDGPGAYQGPLTDRIEFASIIAEELVEQTSSASCNWSRVEAEARQLADLAASVLDSIERDRGKEAGRGTS